MHQTQLPPASLRSSPFPGRRSHHPSPILCPSGPPPQVEVGRNPSLRGRPVAVVQYNPWDTEALKTALRPDVRGGWGLGAGAGRQGVEVVITSPNQAKLAEHRQTR